jgi:predicted acyl esterase
MADRYEMVVDTDIGIPMRDGATLRANFYHPKADGKFPVLMSFGPYGKDVPLKEFMAEAWETLEKFYPEILQASSCKHLVFETADPECFVPDGYIVIKVDSRGAGKSPGRLSPNSPEEFRDFYDAIEWAGVQPWSNGRIGLLGISYYAAGQWSVAAMKPPHLAAMLPWQGTYDFYRDRTRADGIFAGGFLGRWWTNSVLRNQHGNPKSPYHDLYTGGRTTGSESLSDEQLAANRADYLGDLLKHPLNDAWYQSRTPDVRKIDIPTLVVANWGGLGLHLRGTIGGFVDIASKEKWLKVQGGSYFHTFLQPQNVALQKRFFDKYLKGAENGWEKEPKIEVQIRAPGDKIKRTAQSTRWPLAEAKHVKFYLDAGAKAMGTAAPGAAASASYPSLTQGVNFTTARFEKDTEIVGPAMLKLFVSSSTADMDIFATLCAFDPDGKEMTFIGAPERFCPVTQGWLRVSQRKTDPARSNDYFPYHPHDEKQPLTPGEVYEVEVEIWPLGLYLPKGSTLKLIVAGIDFERPGSTPPFQGVAWFTHNDPTDRPKAIFDSTNTIHTGGARQSYLLLPVLS